MNIPDETVEAALKAWGVSGEVPRTIVEVVLDVAAPHIQALSLQSAADEFQKRLPDGTGNGRVYNSHQVARILREQADHILAKPHRGQV